MNRRKLCIKAPSFSFLHRHSHIQEDIKLCIPAQNLAIQNCISGVTGFKTSFKNYERQYLIYKTAFIFTFS